jgi:hypothetical protein
MCMHAYMSMTCYCELCVYVCVILLCIDCEEELNYPCDCCDCAGCYQGK